MEKTLIQAYLNSPYTYNSTRLHLGESRSELSVVFPERWAMVTAFNPESRQLTPEENQERHAALEVAVRQLGHPVDHYVAGEGEWEEPGCFIRGISLAEAVQLGRDFQQNAVLFGVGSRVALVWVDPVIAVRMWWTQHLV
ncbi:DUF3293 domain-containing protein [Deinococcus cellulosilyticus]|uniref:DUF3293 domain-containing protein n=1 Tax=Deinococcus cellulosilyticus (strain DSM 18568 / NBRC 106333 / KACC 11606 / 5516J-15) TaxID=1223518 RepID=A0A511N7G8_DEIC1|nr:DUF3293 domain-containing protein [Deinococcus cellulosilyticus]GEM48782.1 hypothetical protein DC3_44170 [Deinococcus cellulosilyticus NBRC 106333 = KACC 11606]